MNKAIILATFTLSALVMQFSVLDLKPAMAQVDNDAAEFELKGMSADYLADNSEANGDFTEEDELEKEAPYNDAADNELFFEHGASGGDKPDNSEVGRDRAEDAELEDTEQNNTEELNSTDTKLDGELEREAETFNQGND